MYQEERYNSISRLCYTAGVAGVDPQKELVRGTVEGESAHCCGVSVRR